LDATKLRAAISQALEVSPKRDKGRESDKPPNADAETEEAASI